MPEGSDLVVINTGPLVSLGRAGLLEVVGGLALEFVTPGRTVELQVAEVRVSVYAARVSAERRQHAATPT